MRAFKEISVASPTIMVLVPEIAKALLKFYHDFKRNIFGDRLKVVICGGAHTGKDLVSEFLNLGIHLYQGYGLTEMSNMVTGNPDVYHHQDSIGLLFPNQEVKIVDGELWIKGKNLMLGYYNDDESNNEAFSDGYFKTGDLIRIDDDGFLYFLGLKKDIIVLPNGENISCKDIKTRLSCIDGIKEVKVYYDLGVVIEITGIGTSNFEEKIKELLIGVKNLNNYSIKFKD